MCLCYVWCKSCTYLAPKLILSPNGPKWDSTWPTPPRSFHQVDPKQFLSMLYVRHKPCIYLGSRLTLSPNGLNWASNWASAPRSTIRCIQKRFLGRWYVWRKPCTYLASTLTWSLNTRFHMTHVALVFHQVRPKQFLSLWYGQRKPCTYLASRLALSLLLQKKISTISNGQNWASTWSLSPRSTIGCVQNDFWVYGMFGANHAPIFHWHKDFLQMDQNEIPHDPRHLEVPLCVSITISKPMVPLVQTLPLSCVKISTISKWTESSFHLNLVT
jgi:hypothetical protein